MGAAWREPAYRGYHKVLELVECKISTFKFTTAGDMPELKVLRW